MSSGKAGLRSAPLVPVPWRAALSGSTETVTFIRLLVKDRAEKQLLRKCYVCAWSSSFLRQWLWNMAGRCHHPGNLVNSWDSPAISLEHLGRCSDSHSSFSWRFPLRSCSSTIQSIHLLSPPYCIYDTAYSRHWGCGSESGRQPCPWKWNEITVQSCITSQGLRSEKYIVRQFCRVWTSQNVPTQTWMV